MITAPLPRASPSGSGQLSMIIPRYYGLTITCMSVCLGKLIQKIRWPKCVGRITWPKHAHAQSQLGRLKPTCDIHIIHFDYTEWTKKKPKKQKQRSLRNEKLKANRASETEEQRKERLRIRRKKDRATRRLRNTKPRLELRSPHNVSTFYPSYLPRMRSVSGGICDRAWCPYICR